MAFTYNHIIHSTSSATNTVNGGTHFIDATDTNITFPVGVSNVVVLVDTSAGDFIISDVDMSSLPIGATITFKKVTSDSNKIIDGEANHVDKLHETTTLSKRGNSDLIVI